jgi:hypothetical protein
VNGFMHINGVTYDLGPQQEPGGLSQLAMRLRAPQGTHHQLVVMSGQIVELTIDLAAVWASATWVGPEAGPVASGRRR